MRRSLALLILALFSSAVLAEGKPLPRGFEALGIAAPLNLDMTPGDLDRIKGKVIKSGRFISVATDNGYLISMTLNDKADQLVKMVAHLQKDKYAEVIKRLQDFSEGKQYEKEIVGRQEIHTWKDGKTAIRLVSTEDFSRIDLMDLKELEKEKNGTP